MNVKASIRKSSSIRVAWPVLYLRCSRGGLSDKNDAALHGIEYVRKSKKSGKFKEDPRNDSTNCEYRIEL